MIGKLLNEAAIGKFLSGSSTRTGRRFLDEDWKGPVYIVRGRRYIAESDLERYLETRKVDPRGQPQTVSLKSMLDSISERVLKQRHG